MATPIRLYFDEDSARHSLVAALLILAAQQRYSVGEQLRRLLRLIGARSAEEMRDQVEFLSAWSGRV